MSIEQQQDFHQVRRILRAVAPDFRILATSAIKPGEYALDVQRKTIEVGEGTPIMEAVGCSLFSIGHLLLRNDESFSLFFGNGISDWKKSEGELVDELAEQGVSADQAAYLWAVSTIQAYWQLSEDDAKQRIGELRSSKEEWLKYFSL